jgi:hypothetical protein
MKHSNLWLCTFAFAAACGVSTPDDRDSRATVVDDQNLLTAETVADEPAVNPNALSEFGATTSAACHGTGQCLPTSDFSCDGTWSSPRRCGVKQCGVWCGPPENGIVAALQPQEIFRKCHHISGNTNLDCTQWAQTIKAKLCDDPLCN